MDEEWKDKRIATLEEICKKQTEEMRGWLELITMDSVSVIGEDSGYHLRKVIERAKEVLKETRFAR